MKRTVVAMLLLGLVPLVASAAPMITLNLVYQETWSSNAGGATLLGDKSSFFSSTNAIADGYSAAWVNVFRVEVTATGLAVDGSQGIQGVASALVGSNSGLTLSAVHQPSANAGTLVVIPATLWPYVNTGVGPVWNNGIQNQTQINNPAKLVTIAFTTAAWSQQVHPGEAGNQYGVPVPTPIELVGVKWDGATACSLQARSAAPTGSAWVIWLNNIDGDAANGSTQALDLTTATSSGAINFGVPEPATMALLAIGGLGLLLRRRTR